MNLKYVKHLLITILLLCTASLWGQAGTPTTNGAWYLLNEASDVNSGDHGCYSPSQVNFAFHNATIRMDHAGAPYSCGCTGGLGPTCSGTQTITQQYLSGAIMWHDLNIGPSSLGSPAINCNGPCTIEVKAKLPGGWSSIWMLGGNKGQNTGCQTTSPLTWDSIGNCAWASDPLDSAEIDIQECTGCTPPIGAILSNVITNSGSVTKNPTISDGATNFHTYHIDWSGTYVHFAVDGVSSGSNITSPTVARPMFLIILNRENTANAFAGPFPTTMTIQYVQACAGATCTSPDAAGGNTLFLDDFGGVVVPSPTNFTGKITITGGKQQ